MYCFSILYSSDGIIGDINIDVMCIIEMRLKGSYSPLKAQSIFPNVIPSVLVEVRQNGCMVHLNGKYENEYE